MRLCVMQNRHWLWDPRQARQDQCKEQVGVSHLILFNFSILYTSFNSLSSTLNINYMLCGNVLVKD